MVAYRFCRPDDSPALVEAVNCCYGVHFPGEPPLTLDQFQRETRELDVWPSNCMVAQAGADPIAVCIATKRPHEALIHRIGVHPDHQRKGHGRHLLNSLGQKLAVLGPPRIVAEVPAERADLVAFFEAVGYRQEIEYQDYQLTEPAPALEGPIPLLRVSVKELLDTGLKLPDHCCWQRQSDTISARADQLEGWVLAGPERVEAYLLLLPAERGTEVAAWGVTDPGHETLFLSLLLRSVATPDRLPLDFPKVASAELSNTVAKSLGLQPGRRHFRYSGEAHCG